MACGGLARVTFLAPELEWYPTSTLYKQYCRCLSRDVRSLVYRRVSDLLGELENPGLAISRAVAKGKHGYDRQYKLTVPPELIGMECMREYWMQMISDRNMIQREIEHNEHLAKHGEMYESTRMNYRIKAEHARKSLKDFIDL